MKGYKRSFTLIEVLVSFILFSLSIVLILHPLTRTGKNMREESARIYVQTIADEELHQLYMNLLQTDSVKKDRFETLLKEREEEQYVIHYAIQDVEYKKESPYVGLVLELKVVHKHFPSAFANRSFYLCSKVES